ncbi:hypothetical protein LY474_31300 [Myxococcus stipitatus]|uniref:hypothetical protein n=1 Tax=Myxococcus stipitatus TaxID=83455 RepID=UPI001F331C80|nr:hypothetical protein [Myxococcus stipitatus]MCE9672303.1 hypothetical protein [Myxococcus stipitatus]
MKPRHGIAWLWLLGACSCSTPRDQLAIPLGPLIAPKPVVLPAPVWLRRRCRWW